MISVFDARYEIGRRSEPMPAETISLAQAHGRTLREPVHAAEDMPLFDRCAMDGYAIRADDPAQEFTIVGEIKAGDTASREFASGETIRIFTGAALPGPGLQVIPQENVDRLVSRIRITRRDPVPHIRVRGEEARQGDLLLEPGTVLDATGVALLAAIGKTSLIVSKRPRILHLTTGDEIVPPEMQPGPGQIRNSNAALIAALCREQGIPSIDHHHVRDDLKAMIALLDETYAEDYDLVLISGGSGHGAYDFSAELFRHLDVKILFRQVDVRPGKPLIFGTAPRRIVFGLPGNALSHFVCFHLFVRLALNRLLFRANPAPVEAVLTAPMTGISNARETWWPARVAFGLGKLVCHPLPWKSSGDITRLPEAQGLIQIEASTSELAAGTMVPLLLTRPLI